MVPRRRHFRTSILQRPEHLESRRVLASLPFAESPLVSSLGPMDQILVVGDFDGDGRDDIVSASGNVTIDDPAQPAWYRLNLAAQRWEQAGTFPAQAADRMLMPSAAVDMDGDQDLDLVVVSSRVAVDTFSELNWIENSDGKGTFTTLKSMNSKNVLSYHLADYDQDGDTDVSYEYLAGPNQIAPAWSENQSNGFVKHEIPSVPGTQDNYIFDPDNDGHRIVPNFVFKRQGMISSDLDGDGDLDLIENRYGRSSWSENTDGQAHFTKRGDQFERVLPQDIDRDGDMDLWAQNGSAAVWLENRGNWNFIHHDWNVPIEGPIFLADIDDDGHEDLVALNSETHRLVRYEADTVANQLTLHVTAAPAAEKAEAAIDFNRDGRTDLLSQSGWYERTAQGGEFVWHSYPSGVHADQVAVSDLDGDGLPDIVFSEFDPNSFSVKLSWMRQTAQGLSDPTPIGSWGTGQPRWWRDSHDLQIRDLDGDGAEDLIQLDHGKLTWFQQTGRATFVRRALSTLPSSIGSLDNLVDWDGDGDLDAMIFNSLYLQTSAGEFSPSELSLPVFTDSVDVGDLDNDGDLDLAYMTIGVVGWIPFQDGAPGAARQIARYPSGHGGTIHIADLNGDGDLDLVVEHRLQSVALMVAEDYDQRIRLFDNVDGKGSFAESDKVFDHRGPVRLIADVNDDHLLDLVLSPQTVTGIVVLYNQSPSPFPAGDINHDGTVTVADVNAFCAAYVSDDRPRELDVNRDLKIDEADHAYLVENLLHLVYGDSNFDGRFDSADLVAMFAVGRYEKSDATATWSEGDFNCDGKFDSADLVKALQMGGYE